MRAHALPIALLFLAASSPALASASFECEATDASGAMISGGMARAIAAPLESAELVIDGEAMSTRDDPPRIAIGQSWIDGERLWVDLVDPQLLRFEARLRAATDAAGDTRGTLTRDGRAYPVICLRG